MKAVCWMGKKKMEVHDMPDPRLLSKKDAIIEMSWAAGGGGIMASLVGMFAALLTSFYSWRLMFLTFFGTPRWVNSEHIQHALHDAHGHGHDAHAHEDGHDPAAEGAGGEPHVHDTGAPALQEGTGGYHPHESPPFMLIPLIVLSVGAVAAGFVFHGWFIEPDAGERYWRGSIAFREHLMHASHEVPLPVKLSATIVMLLGLLTAWMAYIRSTDVPARFTATFEGLYRFLLNKWYFDELYDLIFVRPAFAIGRLLWHRGDEQTIDRFGPNGSAWLVALGSRWAGRAQTGYLYTYAFVMLIGLTGAVTWAINQ